MHASPSIRSTKYRYKFLDDQKLKTKEAQQSSADKSFEANLKIRVAGFGGEKFLPWIYHNDIENVWDEYLRDESQVNGVH